MTAGTSTTVAEECPSAVMKMWPNGPRSVGKARRFVARYLDAWGLPQLTETAELIVSELVTNAVTHGRPPYGRLIGTRFERLPSGVRIEVHDANDSKPELRKASAEAEDGRGLALVHALTAGQWTYAGSPLVASSGTWVISTTNGETMSGYLPAWAEEDPSKSGVAPDQLAGELSDITHEAAFGRQFMRVCPGAQDPGEDTAMLTALMQCSPFVGDDAETRLPLVNVQVVDDLWIMDLDPSGVLNVAEKFRDFADLLVDTVAPSLSAARAEWAEHVLVSDPQT